MRLPLPFPAARRAACLLPAALVLCGLLSGCLRKPVDDGYDEKKKREKEENNSATVILHGNSFSLQDPQGRKLLDAKSRRLAGGLEPGGGFTGPMKMEGSESVLYQKGEKQMDFKAPEAVWDNETKKLVAEKTAHGVTADKRTIIDSQKATWMADTGNMDLTKAKMKELTKEGEVEFFVEAPTAFISNNIVTMPSGGKIYNPHGRKLTADVMHWHMKTGRLEANGHVVLTDPDTRATSEHLVSDTKLRKSRMWGKGQIQIKQGKQGRSGRARKAGKPGKAGKR
jgi:hypothetical protein